MSGIEIFFREANSAIKGVLRTSLILSYSAQLNTALLLGPAAIIFCYGNESTTFSEENHEIPKSWL